MPTKEIFLGFVAALVVGLVVGFYFGRAEGILAGRELARQGLLQSGVIQPQPKEVKSIGGKVTAVRADTLTLEAQPYFDPLQPGKPAVRYTITLAPATKLVQRELNTTAVPKTGQPFEPFLESAIAAETIKVGDQVIVEADHNVLAETNFAATRVVVVR